MAKRGFLFIDGHAGLGRAPAVPRHWAAALIAFIVAQWMWWQGYPLGYGAAKLLHAAGLLGSASGEITIAGTAMLLSLAVPGAIIGALALHLSREFDHRRPADIGFNGNSFGLAIIWSLAGLAAALPTLASLLGVQDLRVLLQAISVLTSVTILQAGAEEIVFRGVLLAWLMARYGARTGILLNATLFGLWHVTIGQEPLDALLDFSATFVFGVTAVIVTLHYANLGPAIALHVIWNVATWLAQGFSASPGEFWLGWVSHFDHVWTVEKIGNGEFVRALLAPLLIETMLVFAACRDTVNRLLDKPPLAEHDVA